MNKKIISAVILALGILTLALFGCDDGGGAVRTKMAIPRCIRWLHQKLAPMEKLIIAPKQ